VQAGPGDGQVLAANHAARGTHSGVPGDDPSAGGLACKAHFSAAGSCRATSLDRLVAATCRQKFCRSPKGFDASPASSSSTNTLTETGSRRSCEWSTSLL
jgi:hypothetical protein